MRRSPFRFLSALFAASLVCCFPSAALAYSSPFPVPEKAGYASPGEPAEIRYRLRGGGTFLYCNNPETIGKEDLNKALMIENNVCGDVYFTAEHINQTGSAILFGLQLRNRSGQSVTVTVKNVGWQNGGDWCGQREWTDFFGTTYELQPKQGEFYFEKPVAPNPFSETTYELPDGEYFYVCGGSTLDAYDHINVGKTANKGVPQGSVLNAACYFTVDGPATGVDAAFVCYASQRNPVVSDEQQGYVTERNGTQYGLQYLGSAPYLCAECSVGWEVDDTVPDGRLRTTYKTVYHKDGDSREPYRTFGGEQTRVNTIYGWKTHLNPNWDSSYVGTDMMPFSCVTDKGENVVIDNDHSDGTGIGANIGNWMVVYEERLSFRNSGSKARTFTVNITQNGILAMNIRSADGGLLRSYYHSNPGEVCTVEVGAGQEEEVLLEYTLCANGFGGLVHAVVVGTAEEPEPSSESDPAESAGEGASGEETGEVSGETSGEFSVVPLKNDPLVNTWTWIIVGAVAAIGALAVLLGTKKRSGKGTGTE